VSREKINQMPHIRSVLGSMLDGCASGNNGNFSATLFGTVNN
jgi:hypothetical protein